MLCVFVVFFNLSVLIGILYARYIGSKRDIAEFEQFRQSGPIVKVKPIGAGKGAVIAVISDPNYEVN